MDLRKRIQEMATNCEWEEDEHISTKFSVYFDDMCLANKNKLSNFVFNVSVLPPWETKMKHWVLMMSSFEIESAIDPTVLAEDMLRHVSEMSGSSKEYLQGVYYHLGTLLVKLFAPR